MALQNFADLPKDTDMVSLILPPINQNQKQRKGNCMERSVLLYSLNKARVKHSYGTYFKVPWGGVWLSADAVRIIAEYKQHNIFQLIRRKKTENWSDEDHYIYDIDERLLGPTGKIPYKRILVKKKSASRSKEMLAEHEKQTKKKVNLSPKLRFLKNQG